MTRFLVALLAYAAPLTAPAQPPGEPLKLERTLRLVGPGVPTLKHELLPPSRDRSPGNAALGYLRAATLTPEPPRDPLARRKLQDRVDAWDGLPDDQLPLAEVAEYLKPYRPMFRALDDAARMAGCDWQYRGGGGAEEVAVSTNLVQGRREATRLLKHRVRLDLAEGRTTDALRTLQTGLQHARHVGEAGSAIDLLVADAIAVTMIAQAEHLTTRPGAPNLYWALATLPHPFIDPRPSLDGELRQTLAFLPQLAALEAGPVSEAVASKAFRDHMKLLGGADPGAAGGLDDPLAQVAQSVGLTLLAPAARDELAARGWARADLDTMPPAQAVLVRAASIYRELWDDQAALFYLPYPKAAVEIEALKAKSARALKDHPSDPTLRVFLLVLPTVTKVHDAHTRVERRLALFQACEAVRLHAATHGGRLPATLAEVTLPVPNDPVTAKPFAYEVTPAGYRLDAPPPAGQTSHTGNAIALAVTVQR